MWALDFTAAVVASTTPPSPKRHRSHTHHSGYTSNSHLKTDDQSLLWSPLKPESNSSPESCSSPESFSGPINGYQNVSYFEQRKHGGTATGCAPLTNDYCRRPIYREVLNHELFDAASGVQTATPPETLNGDGREDNPYQQDLACGPSEVSFTGATYQPDYPLDFDIDHLISTAPEYPSVLTGCNQSSGDTFVSGYGFATDRNFNGPWSGAYDPQYELQNSQARYMAGNSDNLEWYAVNTKSADLVPWHVYDRSAARKKMGA